MGSDERPVASDQVRDLDQRIWNIERDREGWRFMASRGSDTANHKDHVHVTLYDG